jgi:methenyltetrahydromethanopterin cyclohydrolase
MSAPPAISVNARAASLVDALKAEASALKVEIARGPDGETVIDAGSRARGSIAAGLRIAEICMGGRGVVELVPSAVLPNWPWTIVSRSSNPVIACLASQYAGWKLAYGEGKDAFFALGSGPARALACKEPLFADIGYADKAGTGTLVLEGARPPPPEIVQQVAQDCGLSPARLTFIYAPTQSLAGTAQIVARALEVAMHKLHELKFPLDRVVEGLATAPLPPPHPDFVTAMGRTNDAIIYGGRVHLHVTGSAGDAREVAERMPSATSRDHGRPFAAVFKAVKGQFYDIDPLLFSPAEVVITALESGESFRAGNVDPALVDASFA